MDMPISDTSLSSSVSNSTLSDAEYLEEQTEVSLAGQTTYSESMSTTPGAGHNDEPTKHSLAEQEPLLELVLIDSSTESASDHATILVEGQDGPPGLVSPQPEPTHRTKIVQLVVKGQLLEGSFRLITWSEFINLYCRFLDIPNTEKISAEALGSHSYTIPLAKAGCLQTWEQTSSISLVKVRAAMQSLGSWPSPTTTTLGLAQKCLDKSSE